MANLPGGIIELWQKGVVNYPAFGLLGTDATLFARAYYSVKIKST